MPFATSNMLELSVWRSGIAKQIDWLWIMIDAGVNRWDVPSLEIVAGKKKWNLTDQRLVLEFIFSWRSWTSQKAKQLHLNLSTWALRPIYDRGHTHPSHANYGNVVHGCAASEACHRPSNFLHFEAPTAPAQHSASESAIASGKVEDSILWRLCRVESDQNHKGVS